LNIDFTKLAKIADSKGMSKVAEYLISLEKSIVKKIPFLLEIRQYERALAFAIEGDPNIISKVLSEILQKRDSRQVLQMASQVPDGIRHLRNFAKKRDDKELLALINEQLPKPMDYSEAIIGIKEAYARDKFDDRIKALRETAITLDKTYKDEFYSKMLLEATEVMDKQRMHYKGT